MTAVQQSIDQWTPTTNPIESHRRRYDGRLPAMEDIQGYARIRCLLVAWREAVSL